MHESLRKNLIKDVLVWAVSFFVILSIVFYATVDSFVDYLVSDMAAHRMSYQTTEFAKHINLQELTSIDEESDALVQDKSVSGLIVIDASGQLVHVALHENQPPSIKISQDMSVTQMRTAVQNTPYLRLFEEPIPGHDTSLAIVMDRRPVVQNVYRSTIWTAALLFSIILISILALHLSLKKHLIEPVDELSHLLNDELAAGEKEEIMGHLPIEVASLAFSYEHIYSERVRVQEQLRESESKYRSMFENMLNGFAYHEVITDEQGSPVDYRFLEVNSGFEKLLGVQLSDVVGRTVTDIFPGIEHDKADWIGRYGRVALEGGDDYIESYSEALGKWFSSYAYCPKKNHFVVIFQDISERKEAEQKLHKLSQAIEQSGESVMITDTEGVIEYVNPAFSTMSGYSSEEAIGQTPSLLKSDSHERPFYREMWETLKRGEVWHGKVIDRRKDGTLFPAVLNIAPVSNKHGEISHYVGLHTDVTEMEELEQSFRQAQKMEAIGTLVGGIAHDFNNILAGMTGNLYLIKRGTEKMPDIYQKAESVERLSFRASDLIKQLLTFARKDRVLLEPLNIHHFVRQTLKFLRPLVPENIALNELLDGEGLLVKGDETQLHQLLLNLVNNAVDSLHDRSAPQITIQLGRFCVNEAFVTSHRYVKPGEYIRLSIADNGEGIPGEQLPHLFEPFFTTKGPGKGSGLGLAMAYGAVKSHHGFIEVESEEGVGTVFHVFLPLVEGVADDKPVKTDERGFAEGEGELILLVDDEPNILETGKEVLEMLGYRTLLASNGKEAVECYRKHHDQIALVIMDVVMPKLGGTKAAEKMKKINPHVKVIFSTGYDKDSTVPDQLPSFDHLILSKPYDILDLSKAIRDQLDS